MEKALSTGEGKALNGVVEITESAVLIPCWNEQGRIGRIVEGVRGLGFRIYVVDDGSSDRTAEEATAGGATVFRLERNLGKGAALRFGLGELRKLGFQWAVTMDGDGQHDVSDLAKLLTSDETLDLVIGNRMEAAREMSCARRFVNRWMSKRISALVQMDLPDTQCGFRRVRLGAFEKVNMNEDGFAIESEMVVAFAGAGLSIGFVPVRCVGATRSSRIRVARDTVRWFGWWLRARREFGNASRR